MKNKTKKTWLHYWLISMLFPWAIWPPSGVLVPQTPWLQSVVWLSCACLPPATDWCGWRHCSICWHCRWHYQSTSWLWWCCHATVWLHYWSTSMLVPLAFRTPIPTNAMLVPWAVRTLFGVLVPQAWPNFDISVVLWVYITNIQLNLMCLCCGMGVIIHHL